MTLGQVKKTAYALIDEYSSDESSFTEDEDLASKINIIANVCYHELSGIKPIKRIFEIDRTARGTTDYNRAYDLPINIKKIEQVVARDETTNEPITARYFLDFGVEEVDGEVTTYSDKIYINDLDNGIYSVKYRVYPTDITETTLDTFELELDKDAQMLMPFAIASDILKSDVSSDYTTFQRRYEDQLQKLDVRKTTGLIVIGETEEDNALDTF